MKLISLIFILATTGCFAKYSGPTFRATNYAYTTQRGLYVYNQTGFAVHQGEVEEVVAHLIGNLFAEEGRIVSVDGYKLILVPDLIPIQKWQSEEVNYVRGCL